MRISPEKKERTAVTELCIAMLVSRATVTNYHKFGGFKNKKNYLQRLEACNKSVSRTGSTWRLRVRNPMPSSKLLLATLGIL